MDILFGKGEEAEYLNGITLATNSSLCRSCSSLCIAEFLFSLLPPGGCWCDMVCAHERLRKEESGLNMHVFSVLLESDFMPWQLCQVIYVIDVKMIQQLKNLWNQILQF